MWPWLIPFGKAAATQIGVTVASKTVTDALTGSDSGVKIPRANDKVPKEGFGWLGLSAFEIGTLAMQALGAGLSTAFAPDQKFAPQPRETEQEREIKRRSARRAEIRKYREEREQRGFNIDPATGRRIDRGGGTRAEQAFQAIKLLQGARMGKTLADEVRMRQELSEGQNRTETNIIQPQEEEE